MLFKSGLTSVEKARSALFQHQIKQRYRGDVLFMSCKTRMILLSNLCLQERIFKMADIPASQAIVGIKQASNMRCLHGSEEGAIGI